jgi:poly-beta-1,6-N-acetyl-D-glucosamine synthase
MAECFDQLLYAVSSFLVYVDRQLHDRDVWAWVLFFVPFLVFFELPRYSFPPIALLFMRLFGWPRDDIAAKRAFLAKRPTISVLVVGLNEEFGIKRAIDTLLSLEYPNLEIIVIDDHSTDRMYELARPYADRGLIKLWRNSSPSGRAGKAAGGNLALQMSSGEFVLSVDADTSFDRDALLHMIGPFHDPEVGAVAGNLKVRNAGNSFWTCMQAVEYIISIGLYRRWLNLFQRNVQVSGAFGAFRRSVLAQVGGWDSELAEDSDLSLKIRRSGWKIIFAPDAISLTDVPEKAAGLARQRIRWDKSFIRTFYRKHVDLLNPRRYGWRYCLLMGQEFGFSVLFSYLYVFYTAYLLITDPMLLIFVWCACAVAYWLMTAISLSINLVFTDRPKEEAALLWAVWAFPIYKSWLRLVRIYAYTLELARLDYEDPFLPQTVWRNAPRW